MKRCRIVPLHAGKVTRPGPRRARGSQAGLGDLSAVAEESPRGLDVKVRGDAASRVPDQRRGTPSAGQAKEITLRSGAEKMPGGRVPPPSSV